MTASPPHALKAFLWYWLPVTIWAAVIFLFSTEAFAAPHASRFLGPLLSFLFPWMTPADIQAVQFVIRKLAHWTEFFILSLLFARAVRRQASRQGTRWAALTLIFVVSYAASDEFHQSLAPGRSASVWDVAIDSFGGLCGILWIYWLDRRRAAERMIHSPRHARRARRVRKKS